MNMFPALDPIPLPAPVWLFKVLHIVTLSLHFLAVELLLGGLLVALVLNVLGRRKTSQAPIHLNASASMARRLPMVMTYVINLGVPPLLFAQVLYGRALYTSSVLIGAWWIAVVFLLIGCYWHIYKFTGKIEAGKTGWPMALVALLLALLISRIYSTNMTLMLHPDVWQQMYAASGIGAHFPPTDATFLPRWLFMLNGGLVAAGFWMIWLAGRSNLEREVRSLFSAAGGRLALAALAVQTWLAFRVLAVQPEVVRKGLADQPLYHWATLAWLAGAGLLFLLAAWCLAKKPISILPGWIALGVGTLSMLAMTICRDGIRDLTLLSRGYDVFNRTVATNWTVAGLFIVLFLGGLGCMWWLISVLKRAQPLSEKVTP